MNTRTVHLTARTAPTLARETSLTPALPERAVEAMHRRAQGLVDTIVAWQRRSRDRALLKELDAYELRDIGLTRADVLVEVDKPFWRL